jgi:large subunit ribosomal protein L21
LPDQFSPLTLPGCRKFGERSGGKRELEKSMYAIVRMAGGKQYRAEIGSLIDVERLPQNVDEKVQITDVLLVGDGDSTVIGQPTVDGATVSATVISQFRAPKILVFKYRQRTKTRKMRGHRQYYTRIRIDSIQAQGLKNGS